MEYLDALSPEAKKIGAVNTIVRYEDKLIGHNTDYLGFMIALDLNNIEVEGKKCLILGQGGAAKSVYHCLLDMKASKVNTTSIRGEIADNLLDAEIIINATPVGMYPELDGLAINLNRFSNLETVVDLIYNPMRTRLLCEGKLMGKKVLNGFDMLVGQAVFSNMIFNDKRIENPYEFIRNIAEDIRREIENIVLIGMPAVGKTTLGKQMASDKNMEFIDTDELIVKKAGKSIVEIFEDDGEEVFRNLETEALKELRNKKHCLISSGGGVVEREENYYLLGANGKLLFLDKEMPEDWGFVDRPVLREISWQKLREKRYEKYLSWADEILGER